MRCREMVFIAIGGNIPDAHGTPALDICRAAAAALDGLLGLTTAAVSPWYVTAPVPPSGQPDYVNAVVALTGTADPAALLAALQAIEHSAGRVRLAVNGARTLDLDIAAMGQLVRATPDPVLPHPRMHLRAFVLAPMADIAPDWRHPVLGQTAAALLAGLPWQRQGIRRL